MVVHYKCPNCGADMAFNSTSGMLHCDSCGTDQSIEEIPKQGDAQNPGTAASKGHIPWAEGAVNQYHCQNCGAVLITDKDTVATSCSFCNAAVVLNDRLQGSFAPAKVIPFAIDRQQAQEAFKKWCRKGLLTPKELMSANRIKGITGIYVPFWLYDLNGWGEATAECTKVRAYSDADYNYTETSFFHVHRTVDLNYLQVPVDASQKMDDALMDKLEPYDYGSLKDFMMPYLAGFLAEKYDYDNRELFPRVRARVEGYVSDYINSTINGYTTTNFISKNININEKKADYALFPVWMVRYDYGQKEYVFAMNGQTGKIVGKPPLSPGKIAAWFAGISTTSFVIIKIIAMLLGGGVL
ncbi:hypothetical protein DesLBE_0270 [Desulfitobacterium sp. LBE]|uniref:TFIIB-type zinc ribbon-containing protein n=1 Tax=Desulfitobacterium sp. LBE TaxID=884086 RepID=UPI001199CB29|nr:TFIIB-type zinc ribbon-containing protein [Desulfitobacterium sp. LBE]TWH56083.1 hypothetical protein DesLBE_0270 [Desulfitobacterium sp. LBE]